MLFRSRARSVTTEMFFVYFFGYIVISITLFIAIHLSFKIYEVTCSRRTYNRQYFETLEDKIESDYTTITAEELNEIDGFIIKINNDSKIEYSAGNIDSDKLKDFKLEEYMDILGINSQDRFRVNPPDILSRNIFKNYTNVIITGEDGVKSSIYTRYRNEDKSLLVIGFPYSEITKPNIVTQIIPHHYIIKIFVFCNMTIVLGIVYILTRKTSKEFIEPIKTLLRGVTEVSNGNYDIRIESKKDRKSVV